MRGYMGYTWFSFTLVKAPPHPVSDGNTTNRNTGRISPTFLSHGQTAEGVRGASSSVHCVDSAIRFIVRNG